MDKQIGPYSIVRLIGTGGAGSVYEGVHTQIQRRAAIKILHKDFPSAAAVEIPLRVFPCCGGAVERAPLYKASHGARL